MTTAGQRAAAAGSVACALWTALAACLCLLHVTIASGQTTPAANTVAKNLKKLLERLEPNEMADGVTRFVFCASHHSKALEGGATPLAAEWSACTAKHPVDSAAHLGCVLHSPTLIPTVINLGQQVTNLLSCLLSSNSSTVLCSKKVQKLEDCTSMCADARSAVGEAVFVSSPAVPTTVRKDDCKLSSKVANNATTLSAFNVSLDLTMKFIQCVPAFVGDMYQHVATHIKVISKCSAAHGENWAAWIQCLFDEHDVKIVAPYLIKARVVLACVVGGDLAAQAFCIRSMRSADECRACGGQEGASILDPVLPLAPTTTCPV